MYLVDSFIAIMNSPTAGVIRMSLFGARQMRILEVISSPGTHLGQERLGRPAAAMRPVSSSRYLDVRRNLIWDGEARHNPNR
jgi:hypothetical protein